MPAGAKQRARLLDGNDSNVRLAESGYDNLFPVGSHIQERCIPAQRAKGNGLHV
jgi:hypothetical protein